MVQVTGPDTESAPVKATVNGWLCQLPLSGAGSAAATPVGPVASYLNAKLPPPVLPAWSVHDLLTLAVASSGPLYPTEP